MKKTLRRRGLSLLLVLSVIALASVTGMAMLSSASLQMQTGSRSSSGVQAGMLADSGVELASYYLQYPWRSPTPTAAYWAGGTNISLGSSAGGTVDVSVTNPSGSDYIITSTGKVTSSGETVSRKVVATLRISRGTSNDYATTFNGNSANLTKSNITGDLQALGNLNISASVTVNGSIKAGGLVGGLLSGLLGLVTNTVNGLVAAAPDTTKLTDYASGYKYGLTSYTPKALGASISSGTYGTASDNPGGVWVASGGLTVTGPVTINGTLVVNGGTLNVQGSGITINPQPGMPALIVKGDVQLTGNNRSLTANGLVYLTGSLKTSLLSSGSNLTVNGGIMFGGTGSVDTLFSGLLKVVQSRDNFADVNLDKTVTPAGVTVLSYQE